MPRPMTLTNFDAMNQRVIGDSVQIINSLRISVPLYRLERIDQLFRDFINRPRSMPSHPVIG